jgi:hypothetical protein
MADESTTANTPEQEDEVTEGLLKNAEAYPFNDELVKVNFMQASAPGQPWELKDYLMQKTDAAILVKQLNLILSAPSTQAAWQQISDSIEEHDPDWEAFEKESAEA